MRQKMNVCITGANGNIAYSLYNYLCCGNIFGSNLQIQLRLLEVPSKAEQLQILKLQLEDCCYQKVSSINIFTSENQKEAFRDADLIIFLGGPVRKPGMEIAEVYEENAVIFKEHGININQTAKKTCKCLVVANPVNTNCMILSSNAPTIPKQNFTALTRLDHNRFVAQISKFFNCQLSHIKNAIVWGNHSRSQFCDLTHVEIQGLSKEIIEQKVKKLEHREVQQHMYDRGGFMHEKKGGHMFLSATKAILDHLSDLYNGRQDIVSMSVVIDKPVYSLTKGICFSLPVKCLGNWKFKILDNLELNEYQKKRIAQGYDELVKEKAIIQDYMFSEPK